jgi:hypothetical protein
MKLTDVVILVSVGALAAGVVLYLFKQKGVTLSSALKVLETPVSGSITLADIMQQKAPYYEAPLGGLTPQ